MALSRDWTKKFVLGSLIILSFVLTAAVALNFILHIYDTYSKSGELFQLWLNVLGITVNGLFSLGLLLLYSQMGSTQEEQRDLMEEQRNIDENQRTIMREQTNISENQQRLKQIRQQFYIDIEGQKPLNKHSILVCVSNHGDGVATNPQLITSVSYHSEESSDAIFKGSSSPLKKVCNDEYRNKGRIIGAKETNVELRSEVLFRQIIDGEMQDYTFSEMTTDLCSNGIDKINIKLDVSITDIFGDTEEEGLYRFSVPIHPNMTFEEAIQKSTQ